jgi:MerR family transcriptional regulator, aldehyde-responsive regulator
MNHSIKDVCEITGLSAHTLRYYEKEGLLRDIHRTKGRIRYYTDDNMETLSLICCLKNTGMPLNEIAHFVSLTQQGDATLRERCDILLRHRENVIDEMKKMQAHLDKVTCKIDCFTRKLADYEQRAGSSAPETAC